METKTGKHATWIDIDKPSEKDLDWLQKEFDFHPVIIDELRAPSARGKVEVYKHYLFFVFYFPVYDVQDEASIRAEVDFLITKDAVITVHYDGVKKALRDFAFPSLGTPIDVVYELVEHLLNFEERQLRHIREKVEQVGRDIFKDREREMLERLTYLKRDVSEYRIIVRLQGPIFHSLLVRGEKFWGKSAEIYLNSLIGDQLKVINQVEDYREAITDFENTNNQLMNLKVNSVMKTFTALSFITFPFMLVAALFAMRLDGVPFVGMAYGFWIVTGIIAAGMLMMAMYFKQKGWFQ